MRPAQPWCPSVRRAALAGFVLSLHLIVLALFSLTRTAVPPPVEPPLVVEWVDAVALPEAVTPRPVPVKTPPVAQTTRSLPPRSTSQPVLDTTTRSEAPASSAAAPAAETRPAATASGGGGNGSSGELPLVQARFDADYLKNPAPLYPSMSRRLGEEGKAILRVRVSAEGHPEQVEIKTSSGSSRLDESAQRTLRTWKFIPAKRGGSSVESWVLVPIVFKLEQ